MVLILLIFYAKGLHNYVLLPTNCIINFNYPHTQETLPYISAFPYCIFTEVIYRGYTWS